MRLKLTLIIEIGIPGKDIFKNHYMAIYILDE